MLRATGYGDGDSLYEKLKNQAIGLIILTCAGSLPGYWTAVLIIDTVGRKTLQILGFLCLTVIFCILGFGFHHLSQGAFLALYILGHFFFNAGPNTTTFIIPGECFPTRYRATGHGVSAAMGKIGAIVAQVISIPLLHKGRTPGCKGAQCSPKLDELLKLFALFMLLGLFTSLLVPETKGMTLEELSGETRTSYNTDWGETSSASSPARHNTWNPFVGGRPAGFSFQRSRPRGLRKRNKSSYGMSFVASPELSAQETTPTRKARFFRHRRHRKERSQGESIVLDDRASREVQASAVHSSPADQEAPSWGAGWGRVGQEDGPGAVKPAELQDVGALLQSQR